MTTGSPGERKTVTILLLPNKDYPFRMQGAAGWKNGELLTIVQTGVTAMTRAFIPSVKRSGDLLSPVKFTKAVTSSADIAITSNEVSFLEPCMYPLKNKLIFCSPMRFFKILEKSGFDIIELTGNHNNDFGSKYNLQTIKMIEKAGMIYFGGGKNIKDAESVKYTNKNSSKIAFVGFNEIGPEPAWAKNDRPGAARLSKEKFNRSIKSAVEKADIVLASVQWCNENDPVPWKIERDYFHAAADMGGGYNHIIIRAQGKGDRIL